jgi:hypothetical protein
MRQGSNSKRPRGKGGNRGSNGGGARNALTRSYDSNGPAGRVRGNPHQVHEKYLSLARDAQADDPILAENLLQHADHYFRIIAEATGNRPHPDSRRDEHGGHDDGRADDMMMDNDDDRYDSRGNDNRGHDSRGNDSRGNDNHGNGPASEDDGPQPQAATAREGESPEAEAAPKRTRRPRRPKTSEGKSEDVASDAA